MDEAGDVRCDRCGPVDIRRDNIVVLSRPAATAVSYELAFRCPRCHQRCVQQVSRDRALAIVADGCDALRVLPRREATSITAAEVDAFVERLRPLRTLEDLPLGDRGEMGPGKQRH